MYVDPLNQKIDFQSLLNMANIVENLSEEQFMMDRWFQKIGCRTVGCMVGHWSYHTKEVFQENFGWIAKRFGLSFNETKFLFHYSPCYRNFIINTKTPNNPKLAAKRLRKFIYYKLHKKEILDIDSGSYERMRKTDGNHNVLQKVLTEV